MTDFPERLATESVQAYEAFTAYCALHAERSTAEVAQKLGKSKTLMDRWSGEHQWVLRAKSYDACVASEVAIEHTRRYLSDLEDHRERYQKVGRSLYAIAAKLLQKLNGEMDTFEMTPAILGVVIRAFVVAGDLEAHALGIDQLLPMLRQMDAGADERV